jgi:CheY-like chemotaxis protein
VLSHELRSPLQSVFGWVQVLRTAPVDTEHFTRALATIERNIRQQSQLINDMLDVSRIVTGKLTFHMHPVRVSEVLGETLDELRPQAQARDITVQLALDESPVVVADRGRLRQVLANVFINAVKFTPPGGTIRIASRTDHEDAVVAIQDTGDGISPDLLPNVFDRFRQADTGSTRHHEGLGLGLAIAHHIVEQHGGTITAHSAGPGQGSTFLIRLPRATTFSTLAEPVAPETAERQLLAGVRVLVVDDHQDTVELLQYVLSLAGAAVRTALSVPDALASMREQQPDVLVSDLSMPGEDGYALLAAVRRDYGDGLPAVALSGLARAEDRRRALAAGFDAHLSKPVEPAALVLALTNAVFRKAADTPTSPEALPPAGAGQAGA